MVVGIGCANPRKMVYFSDVSDSLEHRKMVAATEFSSFKLKPGDILNITVQTLDPQSTQAFSTQGGGTGTTGGTVSGYTVSKDGYIEMPMVGKLKVSGLTLDQTREKVREHAREFYKDPLVNVRLANFQVTVLGEVARPGTLTLPAERMGIVDVIGLAGDLTPFGRRDKIMLIREEEGKKEFVHMDINSSEIFKSPYYYVKPGDIIYIEPTVVRARAASADVTRDRYISFGITGVSLIITILSFIRLSK